MVAGALASYLLGDSVTQFSTVIGVYLFAMGVGSYLSKFIQRNLVGFFIKVEILIGLIGGFSASILFLLFDHVASFRVLLYFLIFVVGMLVGIEIPIIMRILKQRLEFKDLVSKVFSFDYIGALFASILFPLVFVPFLGLVKTSFLFGILNVGVAIFTLIYFHRNNEGNAFSKGLMSSAILVLLLLLTGFVVGDRVMEWGEPIAYNEKVVYSHTTPYQKILLTRNDDDLRLYLNGNLQFSSRDEYRYHETLVHPGLASIEQPKSVLILGGGDGLALREVLKYPSVESVVMVELDKKMTDIFSTNELLTNLNHNALKSDKIKVFNTDAFLWVKESAEQFDFIVVDFPDPTNFSLGKLYSLSFYKELRKRLTEKGLVVIQSTSPFVARKSFWCINETLQTAGFKTAPYHTYVPSFGEWGFIIGGHRPFQLRNNYPEGLRYVNAVLATSFFDFPADMAWQMVEVNRLNNQQLVRYFEDEWAKYLQ